MRVLRLVSGVSCALLSSCHASSSGHVDSRPSLADIPVEYVGQSVVGVACLPRTTDSTTFRVALVVDSASPADTGNFGIARSLRSSAAYSNVSASIQRSQFGSRTGTACPKDSGVLFRARAADIKLALVTLDAPAKVLVRIHDAHGRPLADSLVVHQGTSLDNVEWHGSSTTPPNEDL